MGGCTINVFVFNLEGCLENLQGGLENSQKEQKFGGKSFCKTSFQSRMELKKGQKQGRDEGTQEDYPTSAVYFCRCQVVLLRSFISALFLSFFLLVHF